MNKEEKNNSSEKEEKKEESLSDLREYVLSEISGKSEKANNQSDIKIDKNNDLSGGLQHKGQKRKNIFSGIKSEKIKKEEIEFNSLRPVKNRKRISLSNIVFRSVLVLILVLVIVLAVFSFGIYKYGWKDKFSNFLLNAISYPAAIVDNDIILYRDYKNIFNAVVHSSRQSGATLGDEDSEAYKEISEKVLSRMIDNKLIKKIAAENSIFLSDEEVDKNLNMYIEESGGEEAFNKVINDLYLWNISDFKDKLLKPVLLEGKLNEYIISSEDFNKNSKESAESILGELKADLSQEKFIELAQAHSDDFASAKNGGDLGWFERGAMVSEFEEAAFSLGAGEVSDLVKTIYGFHIIMVDEINEKEGKIKARHILIKARNLYDVLEEKKGNIKILNFID